jgi:hypothetical protein
MCEGAAPIDRSCGDERPCEVYAIEGAGRVIRDKRIRQWRTAQVPR